MRERIFYLLALTRLFLMLLKLFTQSYLLIPTTSCTALVGVRIHSRKTIESSSHSSSFKTILNNPFLSPSTHPLDYLGANLGSFKATCFVIFNGSLARTGANIKITSSCAGVDRYLLRTNISIFINQYHDSSINSWTNKPCWINRGKCSRGEIYHNTLFCLHDCEVGTWAHGNGLCCCINLIWLRSARRLFAVIRCRINEIESGLHKQGSESFIQAGRISWGQPLGKSSS